MAAKGRRLKAIPVLHVCISCGFLPDGVAQGQLLYDALRSSLEGEHEPRVALRSVTCLWNCARGCSAAIATPGKWSFLLGYLTPTLAPDLLTYASAYAAAVNGSVMPSRRPPSLRNAIVGRTPPQELRV